MPNEPVWFVAVSVGAEREVEDACELLFGAAWRFPGLTFFPLDVVTELKW
jgi:hypothetical protein